MGIVKQNSATVRHSIKLPIKNTINSPSVAAIPLSAIKIPRMEAWLQWKWFIEIFN